MAENDYRDDFMALLGFVEDVANHLSDEEGVRTLTDDEDNLLARAQRFLARYGKHIRDD